MSSRGGVTEAVIRTVNRGGLSISMEVTTEFEQHRIDSLFSKEPETIRWIDELMKPGETFFDVGANVGVFTLYAALRHGAELSVLAFEPAYHNYYRLCRNLALNDVAGARAYCLALGQREGSGALHLVSDESGSASHSFVSGGSQREAARTVFEQGSITVPLDALVSRYGFPVPQHVKIDTDGYEEPFVAGALQTLSDRRVRSVLIEVTDLDGSKERITDSLREAGLDTGHPLNSTEPHSRSRRAEAGNAHIENMIFVRS